MPGMVTVSSVFNQDTASYGAGQAGTSAKLGWRPATDNMYESATVGITLSIHIHFISAYDLAHLKIS